MATKDNTTRDPYLVKAIVHSSRLLGAFRTAGETLPLREIAVRSGLPKTMAFRLLYTLEKCGLVDKMSENMYQSCIRPHKDKLYKFGYSGEGMDYPISAEISQSLRSTAVGAGIDLLCLENRCNAKIAQRNTDLLIREKVDLAIQFQSDEEVAPIIARKYREAGIPMIAIEVPHPGATYYGADNYEAGATAGRHMAQWAKRNWQAKVDEVILLELKRAGSVTGMRLASTLAGMKTVIPQIENCPVVHLDGDGRFETSFELMRKHLRITPSRRLLVGAINDASGLGALRAFQEAGRMESCAVMGLNSSKEGRDELRQPNTRLIGSVALFPERYGPELVRMGLEILGRRPLAPAIFVKHKLLSPETVDHHYPYDKLLPVAAHA